MPIVEVGLGYIKDFPAPVVPAWSPLDLGSTSGAWFNIQNIATLFQDSTGTTPVVANGNPLGLITNLFGFGNLSQVTSTARPLYSFLSDTVGLATATAKRIKYDFIDDALIWNGATGVYYLAVSSISGIQFYQTLLTNGSAFPINEFVQCIALERPYTVAEKADITNLFNLDLANIPNINEIWEVCGTAYTGKNGSSSNGVTDYEFGSGASYNTFFTTLQATTNRETLSFNVAATTGLLQFRNNASTLAGTLLDLPSSVNLYTGFSNNFYGCINAIPDSCTTYQVNINKLSGFIPDFSNAVSLITLTVNTNLLTGWLGNSVPFTLGTFNAQINQLPQQTVDAFLLAFVNAGRQVSDGTCVLNLGGVGNAIPSATGLANKTILQGRGWTVTTN